MGARFISRLMIGFLSNPPVREQVQGNTIATFAGDANDTRASGGSLHKQPPHPQRPRPQRQLRQQLIQRLCLPPLFPITPPAILWARLMHPQQRRRPQHKTPRR